MHVAMVIARWVGTGRKLGFWCLQTDQFLSSHAIHTCMFVSKVSINTLG